MVTGKAAITPAQAAGSTWARPVITKMMAAASSARTVSAVQEKRPPGRATLSGTRR